MATSSHAAAVKSLNKSPGRRRFVFKTLSQRIDDIDINVFRSLDKLKAQPSEGSSFFRDCLIEWRELNTAEDFISFYEEMMPLVQTLPLILLHRELIFSKLISRLQMKARLSLEPILRLIAALSRDLLEEFFLFLPALADSLVTLLENGADREPEVIEQIFTSWSYIMMYLQKYLIRDIVNVLKVTVKLRYYPKDYVREFMAEAMSFLLRNAPVEQLKTGIRKIILEVVKKPSTERQSGVAALFYYVMRGTSLGFHSRAEQVLGLLMSNSTFSIGDKLNQGSDTIVAVLISAFQRICDNLGQEEVNLVWEYLYKEIIDAVANRSFSHLSRLLSLLIATAEIDNTRQVSDYSPLLKPVDLLIRTFMIPSGKENGVDHLSEVVDKVLQLMLCILEGLHSADDMSTVSALSLQWAPAFDSKNSSLLIFIKELLLKDACILYAFRVNILSAMNDLIETSHEEVISLLFSFFEKLQMNQQCSSFLDGTSEGVSRIHSYLQETICSWICVINNIHDNVSSTQIDEAKLALLWGAIGCYPYFSDIQANSSLLMNLIDALDRLLMNEMEIVAGVCKHIWQSLVGAALASYYKQHLFEKSVMEETSKVLHLAGTYRSSMQVLSAVADYLDYVHGSTLQPDNSQKKYHPELEAQKTVNAIRIFADNLCHSDKAIRVATLRILCHYESRSCEISMNDQPPQKKMKTETGVSHTSLLEYHGSNVIQLLLSIETTPISISTSRKVVLLISKIQMSLTTGRVAEMYIPLVLKGIVGILHNRFSYLWNPASECLAVLISKHAELVWDEFVCYFEHCQAISLTYHDQVDRKNAKLSNNYIDLVERFDLFVSPASESSPHGTVLSLLLQSLQKAPSVIESRSRQIVPLFLEFLGYRNNNVTSVGSFNAHICKGKEWKSVLKEWLTLLKLMRNPKSFYRSQFLKDVLQNRLLDDNDAEIQIKLLDCLLMWKDRFLLSYDQHLKNLIDSKKLREELTTWSLSRESYLIEEGHRTHLVPLIIRLLMPKVRKLKILASRKHASMNLRKAVLGFIAQLDVNELPLFFALLIKPLQIIPMGTDGAVDIFWNISNCSMDEFQELNFFKYFSLEKVAALSWKKIHAFLHVIEDVLGVFDELHLKPFLHLLMGCVARVLVSCSSGLDAVKIDGSLPVVNCLTSDQTSNEKDNQVGDHVLTSSAKQLKDLRSLCLKIISTVLDNYEDHDFGAEFWDLFFKSVKSLIDAFKNEGSSSEKPSSLFACFLAMSRSHKLVPLLYREKNLVPDIFSILTVTTASQSILSTVLKFIENLLTHEDGDVEKLLLPKLEALLCSLHCCFQSATKRKLVKSSGEVGIRIFELLSKYLKDPLSARKFVDILLLFLEKGVNDSVVKVLRDIIPLAGTESTKQILSIISQLLVSAELDMRLCIADLLEALADADSSVKFLAELVRQLNATSASEMGGLDYDTIINAYKKIGVDLFYTREEDHTLVILSHCVYDMSSEDIILRQSAYRALLAFVEFSSQILNGEELCDHEVQTIDKSHWKRTSIQRVINKFLLKHVGGSMQKGRKVKKEWIDLLREMILKLPQLSNLNSFKDLCSGDAEVDFFKNIIHLQRHRRARALSRFRKVISTSNMSEGLMNKVFVPLFFNMLFDAQEENIKNACIEALASICASMEWKPYFSMLTRCFQEMDKNPQKQKILLRLFCSILDQFHFPQICSNQELKDSKDVIFGADTNNTTSIAFDGHHSSDLVGEINTCLLETVLPRVQKALNSVSGEVNVDINRAALKLLKLLPGDVMDSQLPGIIHRISNFLKSRSDAIRNGARLALADCLKELGLEYLQFIVGILRAVLKRGFELHVLGYTLNFILSKNLSNSISGKLDYCLDDLLLVVKDDILGEVSEQKEVEKIASKMIETRKQKSFETLEMIAQNITFKTHALKLLSIVTTQLQKHLTPKMKLKFESMLDHIAAGIESNPSVDQTDLFVFIYGLIEDGIKEENGMHGILSGTDVEKPENNVKRNTIQSGRVIVAKSAGSHLVTVFALRLLQKRLKNVKSNKHDEQQLSMLDSFVTLLGSCLSSKYEDVLSASLRCLTPLVSLPLPSLESQADKIKATLLDIANSSLNSTSPLAQSCLSLLTKLLRSTKITLSSDQLHLLIRFPLFVDLERNPSDVALLLLKAIVNRNLVVPEIYDVIVQVGELMVTSQAESIRKKCSQILLQFLLDYHLSKKRLQEHFNSLLSNLRYEHSSGREAVLEMLHAIIKKFPQTKVDEKSLSLFVHLMALLVNDQDSKVRSMTGVAIKLLIGRVSPHKLDSILKKSLSLYLGTRQQLWGAGAQVLGLFVEVMKKDFQGHINSILPTTERILRSAVSVVADWQLDLTDEATVPMWKEAYYSLVLLEKILSQFSDILLERDLQNIWEATCELLLHPHMWLRTRSNCLIALYFTVVTDASREHHKKQLGAFLLMKPSRLFMIAVSLCCQLEAQHSFDDAVSNRITQNLVTTICNMYSLKEQREYTDPRSCWSTLGESEQSLFLKAFLLLDSGKEKGMFLSLISGTGNQNVQVDSKDLGFLLVSSLLKKMGKIALQKEDIQMGIVFNSFRLISSKISPDYCQRFAFQMLPSLYKVSEGFAGKVISDDMKQLAQEVSDSIRNRIGNQEFIEVYNEMRKHLKVKREKRKRDEKVMAVVNPGRHAKRKLRIAAKHRAHKKRKMMTAKVGRWFS